MKPFDAEPVREGHHHRVAIGANKEFAAILLGWFMSLRFFAFSGSPLG